jgi:hypothetical protein
MARRGEDDHVIQLMHRPRQLRLVEAPVDPLTRGPVARLVFRVAFVIV